MTVRYDKRCCLTDLFAFYSNLSFNGSAQRRFIMIFQEIKKGLTLKISSILNITEKIFLNKQLIDIVMDMLRRKTQ